MFAKALLVGIACMAILGVAGDVLSPREEALPMENSIFRSSEARDRLMQIYDERLAEWRAPYEELDLETVYGTVHVIASGPEDGVPVLLLHASELSATSWARNVEAFSGCRMYAIDHIGEVNKSELNDVTQYPKTRAEIAALYAEIADHLNVQNSIVVGASNGGFIAMSYAIEYPQRVSKLILTGPMGLTPPPMEMGLRLVAAQFIHWRWIEQGALEWILGSSPVVLDPYGEWFASLIKGSFPRVVPPTGIPQEELSTIQAPTLLILGSKDNLVGSPSRAAKAASAIRNLRVEVLESAHLVNWERSEDVNRFIQEFLSNS